MTTSNMSGLGAFSQTINISDPMLRSKGASASNPCAVLIRTATRPSLLVFALCDQPLPLYCFSVSYALCALLLAVSTQEGFSTNFHGKVLVDVEHRLFQKAVFCCRSNIATVRQGGENILTYHAAAYSHKSRWGYFLHVTDRNT